MTIREALHDLMNGRGDLDPSAVLEGYGFDDLPPETLSTALGHFAERSPMDVADALSPIVTRLSDVPFMEGDLPSAGDAEAILADGGGVFELLSQLDSLGDSAPGSDPSDFDFGEAIEGLAPESGGEAGDVLDETLDALEDTFGSGEYATSDPDEISDDELEVEDAASFELTLPDEAPAIDELDDVDGLGDAILDQLAERLDGEDIDPDDLGFDLD